MLLFQLLLHLLLLRLLLLLLMTLLLMLLLLPRDNSCLRLNQLQSKEAETIDADDVVTGH